MSNLFKRILLSLVTIALVSSSAYAGTRALLSDNVTLANNSYSVGSVNLEISKDGDPDWHTDQVTGFTATDLLPGNSATNWVWLRNTSSVGFTITGIANSVVTSGLSESDVTLTMTPVDGSDVATSAPTTATLDVWKANPQALSANLDAGAQQRYRFVVTINSGVTTSGANVSFNMSFVGTQI